MTLKRSQFNSSKKVMSMFDQFDPEKLPHTKIELHVHLDGAVRLSTIWELAQKKHIDLKSKSLEDFIANTTIKKPSTLANFLKPFGLVTPAFCGDKDALDRIAYEFCEDCARQGVIYVEVRYSPHLFCMSFDEKLPQGITPDDVVQTINGALGRGEKDFNIKVRSILCCIRTRPDWSAEVIALCKLYKNSGVVGIDIAGDEAACFAAPEDIAAFQTACQLGIHRTAHTAEAGGAENATIAIEELKAERFGHGYHVLEDEKVYKNCIDKDIHFETCPYSSYMTGSVPMTTTKHPIIRFAEDNVNFSLSRDDPFIIQKTLDQEYGLMKQLGLTDVHIVRANFNAAKSCFLPEEEKEELIATLKVIYGMGD